MTMPSPAACGSGNAWRTPLQLLRVVVFAAVGHALELHVSPTGSATTTVAATTASFALSSVHHVHPVFQRICCPTTNSIDELAAARSGQGLAMATAAAALLAQQQQQQKPDCQRLIVYLHPGLHVVGTRPLDLGNNYSAPPAVSVETAAVGESGVGRSCRWPRQEEWRALAAPDGGKNVLLSGGVQVLGPWNQTLPGTWTTSLPLGVNDPKSVRIAGARAAAARAPAEDVGQYQRSYAPVLSVESVPGLNESGIFRIGVNATLLPASWAEWDNAHVVFFPQMSWFSMRAELMPGSQQLDNSSPEVSLALFNIYQMPTLPVPSKCQDGHLTRRPRGRLRRCAHAS